jgi:1-phosphofructokinase
VKLKSEHETEINGLGPSISPSEQEELLKKIDAMNEGDFVVLAGSIPRSVNDDFYAEIAKKCFQKEVNVVIDTAGVALIKTFPFKPFLIKPNHHELGDLFQTKIENMEDAVFYGKKLLKEGVQNVIVSMADQGALFINKQQTLFANVPHGTVKNSVGAGDSVVAGFLSQITQKSDIQTAFQYGVASGSATAFSDDLCTNVLVEELRQQIVIQG